jgi:tetratricopeptide (TPR) repeat protein
MAKYCTACGEPIQPDWQYCGACGRLLTTAPWQDGGQAFETAQPTAIAVPAVVIVEPPAIDLSIKADCLLQERRYLDAKELLDSAVDLAPHDWRLRMQRAALLGRLGLFPAAIEDVVAARRHLLPDDTAAWLQRQELERWLRDRARLNCVHRSALPKLPRPRLRLPSFRREREPLPSLLRGGHEV